MGISTNILTKSGFAAFVIGAMVAFCGERAEAATVQMTPTFSDVGASGGGPFDVSATNTIYRFDNTTFAGADAGGALFGFGFTADPLPQPVNTALTLNLFGEFGNFQAFWSDDNVIDGSDTALAITLVGGLAVGDQTFTFTTSPQFLIVSYDSAANDAVLDIRVEAVPLPAGGLLLLSALGGVAALRRRRKTA